LLLLLVVVVVVLLQEQDVVVRVGEEKGRERARPGRAGHCTKTPACERRGRRREIKK